MPDFSRLFLALHIPGNLAGDLSLILIFFVLSLVFGFVFGRWKLVNILINVYIAVALVNVLPKELLLISDYAKGGIFLAVLFFLSMVDDRLFDVHITSAGTDFFWRLFVMSFMVTGMVLSVVLSTLPKSFALGFISLTVYGYFASPIALIFWMTVPLLSLLFINNRLK